MIDVRGIRDAAELEAALKLRTEVFCVEQGVAVHEELDGLDAGADHLVALLDGRLVATCRLLEEGDVLRLGRMAVARDARGLGLAHALLAVAHAIGRSRRLRAMTLHAQLDARALYARAGYAQHGDVFLDAGIEHVAMDRDLA